MVIDMGIGRRRRMMRMSGLHGLQSCHSSAAVVVRHRRVRMVMQSSRIGRRRMTKRIAHIHAVMVSRLVEDAAGTGSASLLASTGGVIVVTVPAVDVSAAVAGSGRKRPRVTRRRSVDGGRRRAGDG